MTKQDAYNYFLKALSAKLIHIQHQIDHEPPGTKQYQKLSTELTKIQTALAHLDDIANAVN